MPLEYEELRQLEQWLFDASERCDRWEQALERAIPYLQKEIANLERLIEANECVRKKFFNSFEVSRLTGRLSLTVQADLQHEHTSLVHRGDEL